VSDSLRAGEQLSQEALSVGLRTQRFGRPLRYLAAVDSTNEVARRWAAEGAPEGAVVVADEQTAGRGREGRAWVCPRGAGLLASAIVRPQYPPSAIGGLALVAGIAAARAIQHAAGVAVGLKWPNDIIAAGCKVGGILVESECRGPRVSWAVIGIGLNVNGTREDFPSHLRPTVTTLAEQAGCRVDRIPLFQSLLEQLESVYARFASNGLAPVLADWRQLAWTGTEEVGDGERQS
jgi:BirA family biotin operon repressor/biotin-[acetyl-CoA-carboxylase] ligase